MANFAVNILGNEDGPKEASFDVVHEEESLWIDPKYGRIIGSGLSLRITFGTTSFTISGRDAHRLAKLIGRESDWWKTK